ncbi:S-layer homology domain-containing protein [Paenibacillus radicis (ex Xue et al. 2023)]|uniref:S-layer homology domain-containing protein n=1 Tax=Paenibacillus radicis (ex Xue et al. 2023) TaxID=2972489 RepID=A0ABT1YDS7_9BACL|nr:S-layer homology domain-containing protein [Paenibacillus radicis (ex Xue et al. 2023)]MCR8630920.1 S-layer homology domain-containing protein [Paenibacillus radicis (ex Xue et al. 2023)]
MLFKGIRRKISAVLASVLLFSSLAPTLVWGAAVTPLKDISDSYAQKEILALVDDGVISGYEDGSFQPRKSMSRAELAKIIVLSLGLKENVDKASVFNDVSTTSWYRGFVGALVESSVTQGTSAGTFSPDAKVTREELVVFFIRAFGLETTAAKLPIDAKLADLNEVSDWAKAQVSLAYKIGFVNGIEGKDSSLNFNPKENAERQALARLAYEFKNNKEKLLEKATELTKSSIITSAVSSVSAINSTSIEVTFNQAVSNVDKADFTFDNSLTVSSAELKSGSQTVVVLTTNSQSANTVYKLSYKGKDTGITFTGFASIGGGGGGGGSSNRGATPTAEVLMNQGGTYSNLTLNTAGEYGPLSGTTTITGTLTLNPGEGGEITLRNVQANSIEILSGSSKSIKLKKSKVNFLKVDAKNQTQKVRVESSEGTEVVTTSVYSQAIIEAIDGSLGDITLGSGTSNQTVVLRGSINGTVTVAAANTAIKLEAPTGSPTGKTAIKLLNIEASATISTDANASLEQVNVSAVNTKLELNGPVNIDKVTIAATATGAALSIGSGTNVRSIQANSKVSLSGDATIIGTIAITVGVGGSVSVSDDLKNGLIQFANNAIDAIEAFTEYSNAVEKQILAADIATNNALKVGAAEASLSNYQFLKDAKEKISLLKKYVLEDLEAAKSSVSIQFKAGDDAENVTKDLQLEKTGLYNTTIAWYSTNAAIVSNDGVVKRPSAGEEDVVVALTALIEKQGLSIKKEFNPIKVKALTSTPGVNTGTIKGYVLGADGVPIEQSATVTVEGTVFTAKAGIDGQFIITNVPAGTNYTLTAKLSGFTEGTANKISVLAGETTVLEKPLFLTTGSIGTSRLSFGSYSYTLAEGDRYIDDMDTDKKLFVPILFKDASGKPFTSEEIVNAFYSGLFEISSTVGISLIRGSEIVTSGDFLGQIWIASVDRKGLQRIKISLKEDPSIQAELNVFVGSTRIAQEVRYSKIPNKYMVDNADNEFKIKIYDQYGEEFKFSQFLGRYFFVEMGIKGATSLNNNSNYGFTLSSSDVANPNGNSSARTSKKFKWVPTVAGEEVFATRYVESIGNYEDNRSMTLEDVFDKSFKFTTKNALADSAYIFTIKLYESIPSNFSSASSAGNVRSGSSGGGGGGGVATRVELDTLYTNLEVLDPNKAENQLSYTAYVDNGVNNTLLAVGNYLNAVTDATYVRVNYPKFTKEIKLSATTSDGSFVSIPTNNIVSVTSSNSTVIDATYTKFIAGLTVGTSKMNIVYKTVVGEQKSQQLDVTSKNEPLNITKLKLERHDVSVNKSSLLQRISSGLYVWDTLLGTKLTAVDQFGDEFISDRTPGTYRDDNGNILTDQLIQKYASFLKLTYTISDARTLGGSIDGKVIINSQGQIIYMDPYMYRFTVNIKSPSGIIESIVVVLYNN